MKPMRLIVWSGMPDTGGLSKAGERIGRDLDISVVSSNEDLEALLENEAPFDLICPSDYLVEKLAGQGRLMEFPEGSGIDRGVLAEWSRNPSYDPEERFSVPLAFGTTGLLYSESLVSAPDSWQGFFEPDGYRVGVLNERRELIGAALILAGHSPNATDADALGDAGRLLDLQRGSVDSMTSDDFTLPVEDGKVAIHQAWSGPAAIAMRRTPGLAYVVPREGAVLWVTTAAVPADAPDPDAAIRLLKELMDPEIAVLAVINGGYSTPNERARELTPQDLRDDPVLFPPLETIERCLTLNLLSSLEEQQLEAVWKRFDRP